MPTDTDQLNSLHVAQWLRRHAAALAAAADSIEATQQPAGRPANGIDPAWLGSLMKGKQMRRAELAALAGVDPYYLNPVLTEENGFSRRGNGWYRYESQEQAA